MMLLVIINFMSQSAVTDDFYSQKSRVILTVFSCRKLKKRRKKTMRNKYLFEYSTDNSDCSVNESNIQSFLSCI